MEQGRLRSPYESPLPPGPSPVRSGGQDEGDSLGTGSGLGVRPPPLLRSSKGLGSRPAETGRLCRVYPPGTPPTPPSPVGCPTTTRSPVSRADGPELCRGRGTRRHRSRRPVSPYLCGTLYRTTHRPWSHGVETVQGRSLLGWDPPRVGTLRSEVQKGRVTLGDFEEGWTVDGSGKV